MGAEHRSSTDAVSLPDGCDLSGKKRNLFSDHHGSMRRDRHSIHIPKTEKYRFLCERRAGSRSTQLDLPQYFRSFSFLHKQGNSSL